MEIAEIAVTIIYIYREIDMGSDFVAFFWIQVCVFAFMMSLLALISCCPCMRASVNCEVDIE